MAEQKRRRESPSAVFADAARAAGAEVRLGWEIPGPDGTLVEWLSCYLVNGSVAIVETFKDGGGWDVFTPCGQNNTDATLADAFNRLGVKSPGGEG